jgi:hypothetical protein
VEEARIPQQMFGQQLVSGGGSTISV